METQTFSLKKIRLKMPSAQCCSFRLDLNVLIRSGAGDISEAMHTKVNTLRPRQNGRHFADDSFRRIFLKENVRISIKISLKFVSRGPGNDIPALVQIMAWRRPGGKPLPELMMVRLDICVTRPQWVNPLPAITDILSRCQIPSVNAQSKPHVTI